MLKHRFCKFGLTFLFAMSMLVIGGTFQSCKDWLDEYPYDDPGDPEWLGPNIYSFLKKGTAGHSYDNFVKIIDCLKEQETLSRTGSKTLFVADDEAFERFFNGGNNVWGVSSVEEMTTAQMKVILYNSMLDNAMLLDMLSSTDASESGEGTCLRRLTSSRVIDTVAIVGVNAQEENYRGWPAYNTYWDALRGTGRQENMRLVMDGSRTMMVHFLRDYLRKNYIEPEDIQFLFKKKGEVVKSYADGDAFIYGNKLVSSGVNSGSYSEDVMTIVCKNGYVYRLDELLLPPSNMADELRKREDTKIFSHLLDRFCVPVYDPETSADFNAYYRTNDSIFKLRYFTKDFTSHSMLTEAQNPAKDELLSYDPGSNSLGASLTDDDMAAMFVPCDEVLYEYFANPDSAGNFLLVRSAPNVQVNDLPSLLQALDSVPQKNIAPFIKNLMKSSFSKSVLSKFDRIVDDASELMNIKDIHVDECVVANNGVIYILNNVFGPAAYQAVSAPTLVNDNMDIMRNVINQLRYDYYLLAMDAEYSFLIPDDDYFLYFDPLTNTGADNAVPKVYKLHYDNKHPKNKTPEKIELWSEVFRFNANTFEFNPDSVYTSLEPYDLSGERFKNDLFMVDRMTDLMEYLIIVHDDGGTLRPEKKYYQSKGYGTVKIDATNPDDIKIYGGEQLERGTVISVSSKYVQKNGVSYCTVPGDEGVDKKLYSGIPTPPTKTVYDNMSAHATHDKDLFYEFFKVCYPNEHYASNDSIDILKRMFGIKGKGALLDSAKKYSIFVNDFQNTGSYTKRTVPFFNIYHYTVFVPTNESIRKMHDMGLPTWEQVSEAVDADNKGKAVSMMRSIISFAKHHFQDNAVYVDRTQNVGRFTTAVLNEKLGLFYKLEISASGNSYTVTDDMSNTRNVLVDGEENHDWNIMCRDNIYVSDRADAAAALKEYEASAFAVIQPIDGALLNDAMFGYDGRFKRFAENGYTVDTMYVDGTGYDFNGVNSYLVASMGDIEIVHPEDGSTEYRKAGYLLEAIPEGATGYTSVTREKLKRIDGVYPIVTSDGLWVKEVKDPTTKVVSYEYGVKETRDSEGNVIKREMIKYNYDGTIKERIELQLTTPEEGEDANN